MDKSLNNKPNIVLLILDSVRNDRLSMFGNKRKTTPFLDMLASKGTYFKNCYSASNSSLPAHVSIFTGKPPYFHGASSNFSFFDGKYPMLTEMLKEVGYKNLGVSTQNPYFIRETGFLRGFDHYTQVVKTNKQKKIANLSFVEKLKKFIWKKLAERSPKIRNRIALMRARSDEKYYLRNDLGGQKIIDKIYGYIKEHSGKGKPYFLFANVLEAHTPFLPPGKYRSFFDRSHISDNLLMGMKYVHGLVAGKRILNSSEIETMELLYDNGLRYLDDLVKGLFAKLQADNLIENTVFFILSDHGEMLYEKDLLVGHGSSLYEGVTRVPLIIFGHDYFKGGIEEKICSTTDIFSTIAKICNIEGVQGIDLANIPEESVAFADHPPIAFPERLLDSYPNIILKNWAVAEKMIRKGDFKFIWRSNGEHALYNIAEDPYEKDNQFLINHSKAIELHEELFCYYAGQKNLNKLNFLKVSYGNYCHKVYKPHLPDEGFFKTVMSEKNIFVDLASPYEESRI